MKKLALFSIIVLYALPVLAMRPVYQQGERGIDENGEEFVYVPQLKNPLIIQVVPLDGEPFNKYLDQKLKADLERAFPNPADRMVLQDVKLKQISEEKWEWEVRDLRQE